MRMAKIRDFTDIHNLMDDEVVSGRTSARETLDSYFLEDRTGPPRDEAASTYYRNLGSIEVRATLTSFAADPQEPQTVLHAMALRPAGQTAEMIAAAINKDPLDVEEIIEAARMLGWVTESSTGSSPRYVVDWQKP
jgi:hypothetical protein